ncbi:NADPH-dependent 7-cyano-7-deazaguanine reductase QueF [Salinimonas sp. HHU 13199]|uniref:NADPH-dependent 7-cyano-7-deazaguanine reductase n=1 Tax=Salinimonas profundi TaxID=2729140 RepID=A0ABR8LMT1_9ALTE|nr:NADPH-dependent 7-cyano-7-deazaguanine reductase QueF [Salinimonas profundi]MBD3585410.1 NADPH-dependent 7-cyano-7-deazaguanine reductase QueF [Salinimonas profundi]
MTNKTEARLPEGLSLGREVTYEAHYNPTLLQGVPRALSRDLQGISAQNLPFSGVDTWTGYELSWLTLKGKPQVGILQCEVPVTSKFLIESKSFKLYLNSFNQTQFANRGDVEKTLEKDLSQCAGEPVKVTIFLPAEFDNFAVTPLAGKNIDEIDIDVNSYSPDASILQTSDERVSETLTSDLLKSNCLITSQPDWASILIKYEGNALDQGPLLKYLIGYRQHNEFHEQCVERIFCDLINLPGMEKLTVLARYTRRGGLDINPFRSNFESPYPNRRTARQ